MRVIVNVVVLLCFVLAMQSCKKASEVSEKITDTSMKKVETMDKAKALSQKTDIANLRQAVNSFQAAEGRYPKDLAELEQFAGVTIDKGIYKYDPNTGSLAQMQ
ncbi:hypothetical protein [Candidatus Magnetominusculus dajiuhuensis]|uniref:hypothetical protein n=1 Tax=Candidatus Magnetominusculus dajiuhuensis TaxID=3137712 RepID=UPI003B437C99